MAESIIVHFSSVSPNRVANVLGGMAALTGDGGTVWQYPSPEDHTVTIQFYDHLHSEYDPEEMQRLLDIPGGLPSISRSIELRRSRANAAVQDAGEIALQLIRAFDGAVDDAYSAIWAFDSEPKACRRTTKTVSQSRVKSLL
ncbi:MAG: hypothetical protein V4858_22240 [Pseudomonadota bacterium]